MLWIGGHHARRIARRVALGEPTADPAPDDVWVHPTPDEMAATTIADELTSHFGPYLLY